MSYIVLYNISMKRGTITAFKKYLNKKFPVKTDPFKNNQYGNITRNYGDYLYSQDRDMFNAILIQALNGDDQYKDFKF